MSGMVTAIVIGLAGGVILLAVFALWWWTTTSHTSTQDVIAPGTDTPAVSSVTIPEGASSVASGKNFEPSVIKVVIGTNNTVRWINNERATVSIIDDGFGVDPNFTAATPSPFFASGGQQHQKNLLASGESFEFTFIRPGVKHYHSEPYPWMRGTVIVLPPSQSMSMMDNAELAYDEYHDSAFDFPYNVVNGIVIPTKNDTAIKEIIPYSKYNKELFKAGPGFCYDPATFGNGTEGLPYGDPGNPAVLVAGSKQPAVISFCIHNNTPEPERVYVALDRMLVPMGQVNSTGLEGLNIAFNTRVVDLPASAVMRDDIITPTSNFTAIEINNAKADVVLKRVNMYVTADSDAKEGLHSLMIIFAQPNNETPYQRFEIGQVAAVYVSK
ncbi:MAG: hypothetical protein ABI348_07215 [Nitrososphaera sp.]